jgi:hypothetical protein
MNSPHTEPKLGWTRFAAFLALAHAFVYTLRVDEISVPVLWFDGFVFGCWALGGNGRAMIVDAVRNWKGNA